MIPVTPSAGRTVTIDENDYLLGGECPCDITKNSCDAYCCCDSDCGDKITTFWKTNNPDNSDDNYCAKNDLGIAYKPKEKCIDRSFIYHYNKRLGLKFNDSDDQLCVETDVGYAGSIEIKHMNAAQLDLLHQDS